MDLPEALYNHLPSAGYWDTQSLHDLLAEGGSDQTLRSTERLLEKADWLPAPLTVALLHDELDRPLTQLVVQSLEAQAKKEAFVDVISAIAQPGARPSGADEQ